MPLTDNAMLRNLMNAAQKHGGLDDPEHEVGDLQDILRTCWQKLSGSQRRAVYAEYRDFIEDYG